MKKKYLYIMFVVLVIISIAISLGVGTKFYNPLEIFEALATAEPRGVYNLVTKIRIPRVLLAAFIGAGLAVSGALFQCALKNPLVSPDVIGVNHGAVLGASLLIVFFPKAPSYITFITTFIFGMLTFFIVYLINKKRGFNPIWIALSGMAIGYLIDAFNQVLLVNASRQALNLNVALAWIKGSLYGKSYADLLIATIVITALIVIAIILAKKMDILYLGDEQSIALGENPVKFRKTLIFIGVLINSVVVAIAGSIGFIGVIAPQIAKRLFGGKHINIVSGSALIGAILIIVADALARGIKPPIELPISVFTAIIGAPYFFYLIKKEMS